MSDTSQNFTQEDFKNLETCVELAEESYDAGDEPFGAILIDNETGKLLAQARNHVNRINPLAHPEIALVQWAVSNLSKEERKNTTVYTSGEHCAMCSAAHAWAGLGEIVFLSSAKQLHEWVKEIDTVASPVNSLPISEVTNGIKTRGPIEGELFDRIKKLQIKYHQKRAE